MKVVHLTHSSITVSETFVAQLIESLSSELSDYTVVLGSSNAGSRITNVPLIQSDYYSFAQRIGGLAYSIGKFFGVRRGYQLKFCVQRYLILKRIKKYVISADVVYIDYLTTAAYVKDLLEALSIPYVVHIHGYDITSAMTDPVYRHHGIGALRQASVVIAASNHIRRLITLQAGPQANVEVVRYGLDPEDFIVPSKTEKTNHPSVCFLGRLTEKKHPIALIHAFARVHDLMPNARLKVIGDGDLRGEVMERIKELNLGDCVDFVGAMPFSQAQPLLRESWVFAQHSVTATSGDQEGFALSPAEAALYEIPVVSTMHNGITEHVLHGKTGFLAQEYDYEKMADYLKELLLDESLRLKMGKAGRQNIVEMCSIEIRGRKIIGLLRGAEAV